MKRSCQQAGIMSNYLLNLRRKVSCRINRNTVSGMNAGSLHMLHNTWNQNIISVTYGIHFDFFSHEILVNENRMFLCISLNNIHEFHDVLIIDGNLHSLSTKNVGRTNQYRISQLICHTNGFFFRKYRISLWSRNAAFFQNLVEKLSVFCSIYIFRTGSKNRYTDTVQFFCQLNGCLSSKLHHCTIRLLQLHDVFHIFLCQWLKIQLIGNIEVCADSLRIIVYDDGLVAELFKCPYTVYGTVIKFDTLTDTNRTRAQNHNLFTVCGILHLINTAEAGIIIRCFRCKFCSTGVYYLIRRCNVHPSAEILYIFLAFSNETSNHGIRELHFLGTEKKLSVKFSCIFQGSFHHNDIVQFINKPAINLCNIMNHGRVHLTAQSLCNTVNPKVIYNMKMFFQFFIIQFVKVAMHQAVHMLLQRTKGFHESPFKIGTDTHNLTGSLHLCGQISGCRNEFIKRKSRHFYNAVIQCRFEAGKGFSRYRILYLIQMISESNLGGYLGNRITGRLGSQS